MKNNLNLLKRILFSLVASSFTISAMAAELSFDGGKSVQMFDNIEYKADIGIVEFYVADPVICYNPNPVTSQDLNARVRDSNYDSLSPNQNATVLPILTDMNYDFNTGQVFLNVSNKQAVCVTKDGTSSSDLIFRAGFGLQNLAVEGLPQSVVPGQQIDYDIVVNNLSNSDLEFDLVSFVPTNINPDNNPASFSATNSWSCDGAGSNSICTVNNLTNATLTAGQSVKIDVRRTVDIASEYGESIDMLTALFIKDSSGELQDVIVSSNSITATRNQQPVLEWTQSPGDNDVVYEDQPFDPQDPVRFSFLIDDSTGVTLDDQGYLNGLNIDLGKFELVGGYEIQEVNGNFEVSFNVVPQANQFGLTEVEVNFQDDLNVVADALEFQMEILGVNDAPSFELCGTEINIVLADPANTDDIIECIDPNSFNRTFVVTDFITNESAGGDNNNTESAQNISYQIFPGNGFNSNQIFTVNTSGGLSTGLLLLSDGSVNGDFKVRAVDSGLGPIDIINSSETEECNNVLFTDNCNASAVSDEIEVNFINRTYEITGVVDGKGLTGSDFIRVMLYDNADTGGNPIAQSFPTGNSPTFDFGTATESLVYGFEYRVEIENNNTGVDCLFDSNNDTSLIDTISGDVDLVITCTEQLQL